MNDMREGKGPRAIQGEELYSLMATGINDFLWRSVEFSHSALHNSQAKAVSCKGEATWEQKKRTGKMESCSAVGWIESELSPAKKTIGTPWNKKYGKDDAWLLSSQHPSSNKNGMTFLSQNFSKGSPHFPDVYRLWLEDAVGGAMVNMALSQLFGDAPLPWNKSWQLKVSFPPPP